MDIVGACPRCDASVESREDGEAEGIRWEMDYGKPTDNNRRGTNSSNKPDKILTVNPQSQVRRPDVELIYKLTC